jgi:hypothetical protein
MESFRTNPPSRRAATKATAVYFFMMMSPLDDRY